jgi:hypothetical protein
LRALRHRELRDRVNNSETLSCTRDLIEAIDQHDATTCFAAVS